MAYFHGANGAVGASYYLQGIEVYLYARQVWGRLGASGAPTPLAPS